MARPRRRGRAGPAGRCPVLLVSPVPDRGGLAAVGAAAAAGRSTTSGPAGRSSRSSTAADEEPWKHVAADVGADRPPARPRAPSCACTTRPGRARILACRSCRALVRCERVRGRGRARPTRDGWLCRRCGAERPPCACLRWVGVRQPPARCDPAARGAGGGGRAAGRRGHRGDDERPREPPGSTSARRRCSIASSDADVVAFLDFDAELLAPRYRAAEQAMALLASGARLVGARGCAAAAAGADVPAPPRGAPGGAARRSRPAGPTRRASAGGCSACPPFAALARERARQRRPSPPTCGCAASAAVRRRRDGRLGLPRRRSALGTSSASASTRPACDPKG